MIGADRITAESVRELDEALKAGRSPEPVLIKAHAQFARNCAENFYLSIESNPSLLGSTDRFRQQALNDQVGVVEPTNRFFFGESDPVFDDKCREAVFAAFQHRLSELRFGWLIGGARL